MAKIALCFSGHIRNFSLTFSNFKNNLLDPLLEAGYTVDTFSFFWNVLGNREQNWNGDINHELHFFVDKMKPKKYKVMNFDRNYFCKKYYTDQWKKRPHLSCPTTSGDAVCMWFAIKQTFDFIPIKNYDLIMRLRTDCLYNNKINIEEIQDAINNNVIYIPQWSGKYYDVNHEMVDYFAFGNTNVMKIYCSTMDNIPTYLSSDKYIHTGEGFLLEQLKNVSIKRTKIGFSLQRSKHIEILIK